MKILAVEDNPADVGILRELLDLQGSSFEIVNAKTLAAADDFIARGDVEFILLDLGLPDSQGIETLRGIRARHLFIPIVVLTGFDDEETGVLALREGAQDYLVKGQITGHSLARSIRYADERNRIDQELVRKNADLDAMNEELAATDEELRQANDELLNSNARLSGLNQDLSAAQEKLSRNIDELTKSERDLRRSEASLKDALAEKEILLSEIHHRVKNNLAAFISLLSLGGSYEETPAGTALKKDLQNRARTMALIHETLYNTRQYSVVDMEIYLSTLVDQVVGSYSPVRSLKAVVDAKGIALDLFRATPTGLIVNELVTNSLKYAFPTGIAPRGPVQDTLPMIRIGLSSNSGVYCLRVSDNGVGLPPGIDLGTTRTLGLKLVNFLAKHQLRTTPEINTSDGTEFVFRFGE